MTTSNEGQTPEHDAFEKMLTQCKSSWSEALSHQKKAIKHYENFEQEMVLTNQKAAQAAKLAEQTLEKFKTKVEPEIKKFLNK